MCTISLKHLAVLSLSFKLTFVFQEEAHIHMIYKSAGREGLRDLSGGKMLAEWLRNSMGNILAEMAPCLCCVFTV